MYKAKGHKDHTRLYQAKGHRETSLAGSVGSRRPHTPQLIGQRFRGVLPNPLSSSFLSVSWVWRVLFVKRRGR